MLCSEYSCISWMRFEGPSRAGGNFLNWSQGVVLFVCFLGNMMIYSSSVMCVFGGVLWSVSGQKVFTGS